MRPSGPIVEAPAPKTAVIKGKAHLFTLLSVLWTAFTLLGVLFFGDHLDPDHWIGVALALIIWALHLAFIALSIYFWIFEKPKQVLVLESNEDGGD
jgi:hypothetical protein